MYILDTCAVSDFVKGDIKTLDRIKSTRPNLISISVITLMEIRYGLLKNPEKAKKISGIIDSFVSLINVIPFTSEDAEISANIRLALTQIGTPIGYYDYLIAATAIRTQLILVSSNVKEFERISQITIENWRS
jgi:tRNA(fMet)-specific endonuclease VapC